MESNILNKHKTMKTKYVKWAVAIMLLIAMGGCKKEQSDQDIQSFAQSEKKSASAKLLRFENFTEFNACLDKVRAMTFDEKNKWEDSIGFYSFGRASDEFYLSLNTQEINPANLEQLVKNNSDYLQLLKDENGEFTLESAFWDDARRRLINVDKMYQIGETVFKLFNFGVVSTHVQNIETLKQITEANYLNYRDDKRFEIGIQNVNTGKMLKDGAYNCGTWKEDRATNGNDRTYLRVGIFGENLDGGTYQWTQCLVRPYKKTLGIWYWCFRHISCDVRTATDYFIYYNTSGSGYWERFQGNKTEPPT